MSLLQQDILCKQRQIESLDLLLIESKEVFFIFILRAACKIPGGGFIWSFLVLCGVASESAAGMLCGSSKILTFPQGGEMTLHSPCAGLLLSGFISSITPVEFIFLSGLYFF